jgi:hypothetical protein
MKNDDPISSGGQVLLVLGAMAFLPPLFDYEFLITAWLGSMQQPVGLSAMVVGGVLLAAGKLRQFRNSSPVISPTDPEALGTPNLPKAPEPPAGRGVEPPPG